MMDHRPKSQLYEAIADHALAEMNGEMDEKQLSAWKAHLAECPACEESTAWLRDLREGAAELAEGSCWMGCGALSISSVLDYLQQKDTARGAAHKVAIHIAACPHCSELIEECADWAGAESEAGAELPKEAVKEGITSLRQTLADNLRSISSAFPQVLERVIELLQSTTLPIPALQVTLGAAMLRAFQPLRSDVRKPFEFIWSAHGRADSYLFRVSNPNIGKTHEISLEPTSGNAPERLSSDCIEMELGTDVWCWWSVDAFDAEGRKLGETGNIPFRVSCAKPEQVSLRKIPKPKPKKRNKKSEALGEIPEEIMTFVTLSSIGLHDEAVKLLTSKGAVTDVLYAACLVSLYDYRLAECVGEMNKDGSAEQRAALGGAAVHLNALRESWVGVLSELREGEECL